MFNYKLYKLQRKLIYKKYGFLAFFVLVPHQFRFLETTNLQKYASLLKFSKKAQRFLFNFIKSPIVWIFLILTGTIYYTFENYGIQINIFITELYEKYLKFIN